MTAVRYSRQFGKPCIFITKEDAANIDAVVAAAREEGAVYDDGEGECFVVEFDEPRRPGIQELYTETALRSSLKSFQPRDEDIAGKAHCGCVYHAEDGIPCEHDRALARTT